MREETQAGFNDLEFSGTKNRNPWMVQNFLVFMPYIICIALLEFSKTSSSFHVWLSPSTHLYHPDKAKRSTSDPTTIRYNYERTKEISPLFPKVSFFLFVFFHIYAEAISHKHHILILRYEYGLCCINIIGLLL